MGASSFPVLRGALVAVAAVVVVAVPLPSVRAAAAPDAGPAFQPLAVLIPSAELRDPDRPAAERFVDAAAGIAITPPAGWRKTPDTALNPSSDPPEPVEEVARFQLQLRDAQLYAAPIPITSGLVADAAAVISIGIAREGSDILAMERGVRGSRDLAHVAGFIAIEDETTYEGLHVLTRYLLSRESDRAVVVRGAALETAWPDLEGIIRASLATAAGDPRGANAPAPAPPPPPPPPPPPAPDASLARRDQILVRAASLLGLRYVWGGNSTTNGMDCSAYVSWVWGVSRYTTDSIWNVSFPITKAELRPGDALNLTIGRDPRRLGHIRLFEAWANAAGTAMWVYEETPPRVVHRVIAYDDRYQPIRLNGLSGAGEVRLIPGTPAPARTAAPRVPATRRPSATVAPTRRPAATPTQWPAWWNTWTPRPTVRVTVSPTPIRSAAPAPTVAGSVAPTPRPSPTPTPRPSATATPRL